MSGRGGGRGGGRGRGRGGFVANSLPAMGITFQELSQLSREPSALYPPMDMPNMPALTETETRVVEHQIGVIERLKQSPYWIIEEEQAAKELERYSDQFRKQKASRPTLQQEDLCQEFFPASLWDGYFDPTKRPKAPEPKKQKRKKKVNIDTLGDEGDDQEGAEGEEGAQTDDDEQPDYDVEDLEGDDYEANYFDNGEGDDDDDMNADGGGGGDYD